MKELVMAPLVASARKNPCCRVHTVADAQPLSAAGTGRYGESLFVGMDSMDNAAAQVGRCAYGAHSVHATAFERVVDRAAAILGVLTYRG